MQTDDYIPAAEIGHPDVLARIRAAVAPVDPELGTWGARRGRHFALAMDSGGNLYWADGYDLDALEERGRRVRVEDVVE